MLLLAISGDIEPVIITASATTLAIIASPSYIQALTELIYEGIDLWSESELTG